MEKEIMIKSFKSLDSLLKRETRILVGGGAAMILAHGVSIMTMDIDGLLSKTETTPAELDPLVKKVAHELKIDPHWFNSFFNTFTYTIPADYEKRLVNIYDGKKLKVFAFGLDDLLIMKCFAGREKDTSHAKVLIKKGADLKFVEEHIQKLMDKGVHGADKAMDFLDEARDQLGK